MTDERLDQILKQALSPEIDDSEIQIRRKVRKHKMDIKKIIVYGVVACAVLTLVVAGGYFGSLSKTGEDENANVNERHSLAQDETANENEKYSALMNLFAITAYAAELPEGISSGDVVGLSTVTARGGSAEYLDGRFAISGQNIEKVKIVTDKCNLYSAISIYEGDAEYEKAQNAIASGDGEEYVMITDADFTYDETTATGPSPHHYEHLVVEGDTYEGEYNNKMLFGMSVPEELRSKNDDDPTAYHEDVDQVNGATLTIEVTFLDGSTETHHYRLNTGKIYVPSDENGYFQWNNLTRFISSEEEPYTYGYLMEKID